jgi:hypothetical protein
LLNPDNMERFTINKIIFHSLKLFNLVHSYHSKFIHYITPNYHFLITIRTNYIILMGSTSIVKLTDAGQSSLISSQFGKLGKASTGNLINICQR